VKKRLGYTFGGIQFRSLEVVGKHVQKMLRETAIGVLFEDAVLADLATARHYGIRPLGVSPLHFIKRPSRARNNGWDLCAELPGLGWKTFSYKKCLQPWGFEHEFKHALRERFSTANWKKRGRVCERCDSVTNLDLHHVDPKVSKIVQMVLDLLSSQEREEWLGFKWDRDPAFVLPEEHPAIIEADRLNACAVVLTLCKKCHHIEHRKGNHENED
jgi:hypothetical protein